MLLRGILLISALLAAVICGACGGFAGIAWLWMLPVGFVGVFLLCVVAALLFLWIATSVIDPRKEQETDSPFYRRLTEEYIQFLLPFLRVRIHTQGMEQMPQEGRFLLVCNHLNDTDPAVLLHCFRGKQLAFISKRENDSKFIVGKLMRKLMCQPINRENDREALKTILKCISMIKEDKVSVGVFPEGYVSLDRKLHHFRHGVFKIAQKANVPIVVCTLRDTYRIFKNAKRLKPTDVQLHLVGVVPAEELKGVTAIEVGERVYRMMAEDLGPELVLQDSENT